MTCPPAIAHSSLEAALTVSLDEVNVCEECGSFYTSKRINTRFCKPACNRTFHSRAQTRGGTLIPVAMEWRSSRGGKKDKFAEMCHLLDGWHQDDKTRNSVIEGNKEKLREMRRESANKGKSENHDFFEKAEKS